MGRARTGKSLSVILSSLAREESGQAITEFLLLMSVVVFAFLAIFRGLTRVLDRGVLQLGGELEKNLRTGRLPVGIWDN